MGQGEVLCLCGFLGVFFCICDCVKRGLGREVGVCISFVCNGI